jgi:hypothetical protein
MELNDLFGIPAHPLVVHAAVVLLPLAAFGTVIVAAIPRARRHYAPVVFAVALVAMIAVGLAQQSGESLEERVTETELVEEHTEQGETVLPWAIALTVIAGAVAVAGPARKRLSNVSERTITAVLIVGALVVGAGATWTVATVGHSGAKATWEEVTNNPTDD